MKNPEPQGASPKRKRRLGAAPLFGDMLIPSQKSTAQSLRVGRDEPAATSGLATGHLNSVCEFRPSSPIQGSQSSRPLPSRVVENRKARHRESGLMGGLLACLLSASGLSKISIPSSSRVICRTSCNAKYPWYSMALSLCGRERGPACLRSRFERKLLRATFCNCASIATTPIARRVQAMAVMRGTRQSSCERSD